MSKVTKMIATFLLSDHVAFIYSPLLTLKIMIFKHYFGVLIRPDEIWYQKVVMLETLVPRRVVQFIQELDLHSSTFEGD